MKKKSHTAVILAAITVFIGALLNLLTDND